MIAVFDSGIGGLTVLKELYNRHPSQYVYVGDTAHLPYGTKSPDAVRRYTLNAAAELQRRFNLRAFVIACHTASVAAAEAVRSYLSIPVFDMVMPLLSAVQEKKFKRIAILGTPGTIEGGKHAELLSRHCEVLPRSCPLFVPLAEEGWHNHEITDRIAEEYLADLRGVIDGAVLACTHYPLLRRSIQRALGDTVELIDPATLLADVLDDQLPKEGRGGLKIFASDRPYRFEELVRIILGKQVPVEHIEL